MWGAEQRQAFEALKGAVSSTPCLAIPDPQREFIVHTDASGYATGAVLMQQFGEGLRPIAFLSKKMTPAERNYPVHEQELLAILNALKACHRAVPPARPAAPPMHERTIQSTAPDRCHALKHYASAFLHTIEGVARDRGVSTCDSRLYSKPPITIQRATMSQHQAKAPWQCPLRPR